jgi:SAM-dependent methyltransferase
MFKNCIKRILKIVLNLPLIWICKREYRRQKFTRFNERAVEYAFVFSQLAKYVPKKILDVGTGTTALPHLIRNCGFLVTAIDNINDYWPMGMYNRHYYVIDDDILKPHLSNRFDLITCVSVLEHIKENSVAVKNMLQLLDKGGYLILTFPYNENQYIDNVYKIKGSNYGQDAPYVCQVYSRNNLNEWLKNSSARIIEQEYWQFWEGDFWTIGNQVIPPRKVGVKGKHQLSCVLMQKL